MKYKWCFLPSDVFVVHTATLVGIWRPGRGSWTSWAHPENCCCCMVPLISDHLVIIFYLSSPCNNILKYIIGRYIHQKTPLQGRTLCKTTAGDYFRSPILKCNNANHEPVQELQLLLGLCWLHLLPCQPSSIYLAFLCSGRT